MLKTPQASLIALAALAMMAAPESLLRAIAVEPLLAQTSTSTSFPVPSPVPTGTMQVDGSASMTVINEYLKGRFEAEYPGTQVQLATGGSDAALQALVDGAIDLAALGRPLSQAEQAQGLVEVPISREKIAILVGADNPFSGNLTFEQFARIFRGEIINWSQVGGPNRAIRLVDRPETSDTRRALSTYSVFQTAPFITGKTAVPVDSDETAAVIEALGADGIGYAIYSQVQQADGVKIIPMHQTLPDNPAYPFSQPRSYVYYQQPSPLAAVLLNYATSADGQATVAEAREAEAEAVASGDDIAAAPAPGSDRPSGFTTVSSPDGSRVLRLGTDGQPQLFDAQGNPVGAPLTGLGGSLQTATFSPDGRAIALGDDVGNLGFWSIDGAALGAPLALGGAIAALNLAPEGPSVTATLADGSTQTIPWPTPASATNLPPGETLASASDAPAAAPVATVATPTVGAPNGPYAIDPRRAVFPWLWWLLGLLGLLGLLAWWKAGQRDKTGVPLPGGDRPPAPLPPHTGTRPSPVPSPADNLPAPAAPPPPDLAGRAGSVISADRAGLAAGVAGAAVGSLGAIALLGRRSRITLEPRPAQQGYATWDAAASDRQEARNQGGDQFGLRLYDVTALDLATQPPHSLEQFDCDENLQDLLLPIPAPERDYLAEIGYGTGDGRWLAIARSTPIRIPAEVVSADASLAAAAAVGAVGLGALALGHQDSEDLAQTQVEAAKYNVGQSDLTSEDLASVDEGLADLPEGYGESQIVLLPRDPQWAYAYWDVPDEHRQELRRQGGERLALRFYDVTHLDLAYQNPTRLQQYDCDEMARDWYIPVPVSDRDYIAEIGYVAADGRWLSLARSAPIHVPPLYPSDWYEEQFITVDDQENLRGKTFLELVPPGQRSTFDNPIYDQIFGLAESAEAQRVAGSLFGSMHQVPGSVFGSMHMASGQALSSGVFPSGAAIGSIPGFSVPTLSGAGMSGMGMSGMGMSGVGMSGAGLTMSGIGFAASMPPIRARKFWLVADAELIIYGATEPDATVTIAGRPVRLNPDGTFRFQMAFPDGMLDFPIQAVAVDGEQTRSIHLSFVRETPERNTNTREDARDEWF